MVFSLVCIIALVHSIIDGEPATTTQQTLIMVCFHTLLVLTYYVRSTTVIYSFLTALVLLQQPLYHDAAAVMSFQTHTLIVITHVLVY